MKNLKLNFRLFFSEKKPEVLPLNFLFCVRCFNVLIAYLDQDEAVLVDVLDCSAAVDLIRAWLIYFHRYNVVYL